MILTASDIKKKLEMGELSISPFNPDNLGSNSYDLTLDSKLIVYTDEVLDLKKSNNFIEVAIPETGLVLKPGVIYLAKTNEYLETNNTVPIIYGKSSLGRLGLTAHICSGFGDLGFRGNWTLQLSCLQPIKIYSGIPIAQVAFHTVSGKINDIYNGKYQDSFVIEPSKYYRNFKQ